MARMMSSRAAPMSSGSRSESDTVLSLPEIRQQARSGTQSPPAAADAPLKTPLNQASPQYIRQCHVVMDNQRQTFEAERALWNLEREELHKKIKSLEASLQQLQTFSSSSKQAVPINTHPTSALSISGVGETILPGNGPFKRGEIWKGSGADQIPTRVFPESATQAPQKNDERLPSISEAVQPEKSVKIDPIPENPNKPQLNTVDLDKDFDGITFKKAVLSSSETEDSSVSSTSLSPSRSPPVSNGHATKPLHQARVPVLQKLNRSSFTMDAGHTPLSRHSEHFVSMDGVSEVSSPQHTPTKTSEVEQQHIESRPPKPPSERQDSYFPQTTTEPLSSVANDAGADNDVDPELKPPLGLGNEETSNSHFLSELNERLQVHADSSASVSASPSIASPAGESKSGGESGEPTLRIKRSMNFGRPMGEI